MFTWMRRTRRGSLLEWGLEPQDQQVLQSAVWQYSRLSVDQKKRLDGWIRVFITEKNWEPCGGLPLDRSMQLSIAGQAGLLALGWDDFYFDQMESLLVYPSGYVAPHQKHLLSGGFYLEGDSARDGESWPSGPIVLNWKEVAAGGATWNEGGNLVLHEFTHQIDAVGERNSDGAPPLSDTELATWRYVYQGVRKRLADDVARNTGTVLDPYGLEDDSELFAVSVEAFYQHADWVHDDEPELFALLQRFFNVDPRIWGTAPGRPK